MKISTITLIYYTTEMSHGVQEYLPLSFLFFMSYFNRFLSPLYPSECQLCLITDVGISAYSIPSSISCGLKTL